MSSNREYWERESERVRNGNYGATPSAQPPSHDQPYGDYGPPPERDNGYGDPNQGRAQGRPPRRGQGGSQLGSAAGKAGGSLMGFILKSIPFVLTGVVMLIIGAIFLSLRMSAKHRTSALSDAVLGFFGVDDVVGPVLGVVILIPTLLFLLGPIIGLLFKFKVLYIPAYVLGLFLGVFVNNWLLAGDIIPALTPFLQHIESLPELFSTK